MNTKIIKSLIAIAIVVCTALTVCSCGGGIGTLVTMIDNGQYSEAIAFVDENQIPTEVFSEIEPQLKERIENLVKNYAEETISYSQAKETFDTIKYICRSGSMLSSELSSAGSALGELQYSKESYASAMEEMQKAEYLSAKGYFENVIEADTKNYADAQAKATQCYENFVNAAITEANNLKSQNNFDEAVQVLYNASYRVDDDRIDNLIEEIENAKEQHRLQGIKDEVLQDAKDYVSNGDYQSAFDVIKEFEEDYDITFDDLTTAYNNYKAEYVNFISTKVEALRAEKKYLNALTMLENAKQVVEDAKFTELENTIKSEKPIYLCDLKFQRSSSYETVTSGNALTDNLGNQYSVLDGNLFRLRDGGYVDYYVGYKYNKISGTIAVCDTSDNATATLTIEGDGIVLQTIEISRLTVPTPFSIDITNVNYLTIKLSDASGWNTMRVIVSGTTLEAPKANAPAAPASTVTPSQPVA